MENKKLGIILVILSLVVGGILFYYNLQLISQSEEEGCFSGSDCKIIEKNLSMSHLAVGIFSFIFALGVYLLLFNKTDEKIFSRLEDEKNKKVRDEKFGYILKALDPFEQKVIKAIKEQSGITQSTLRLRLDMSKAKLSYVLQELERRNLIKRTQKGKTLAIYLKI